MPLEIQLKAYADAVNARLDQLLPAASQMPSDLHQAMRYSCLAPGKRLRPALCLACAEAVSPNPQSSILNPSILDAACAIEMVHCFSLIHDDLPAIDDDDLRRGLPSCHRKFGEAIAILAGDALFALAFETIANLPNPKPQNSNLKPVLRAIQILTRASGSNGLVGGEVVDVLSEGETADEERLRYIHSHKTGALMSAACEIGAVLVGGSDEQVGNLKAFGERVGLAFQIADDVLNETADASRLGKATGSDRDRAKATYVALFGVEQAREIAKQTAEDAKGALAGFERADFLYELADFTVHRLH